MWIERIRSKYRDLLAAGLFDVRSGSYLENEGMEEYVSSERMKEILSRMEGVNMDEMVAVGERITLFVLKLKGDRAITCIAPSNRPFGFCRELMHQIAKELQEKN